MSQHKWWGYLHIKGTINVKRFFSMRDLTEARESDFVERVVGPFNAMDRSDAQQKCRDLLTN